MKQLLKNIYNRTDLLLLCTSLTLLVLTVLLVGARRDDKNQKYALTILSTNAVGQLVPNFQYIVDQFSLNGGQACFRIIQLDAKACLYGMAYELDALSEEQK